jgi:hypothetical protein
LRFCRWLKKRTVDCQFGLDFLNYSLASVVLAQLTTATTTAVSSVLSDRQSCNLKK